MRTILFVCTGNTCRSPMAEAIARIWLARQDRGDASDWFVASAGVAAIDGVPVSRETITSLEKTGIEHHGTAKRLTPEMIRKAWIVLCMTRQHAAVASELVWGEEQQTRKIRGLDPQSDVDDPIGRGQAAYDALSQRLLELIPARLEEVLE